MRKIGVIAKDIPRAHGAVRKLVAWLTSKGKKVFLDERTAAAIGREGYPAKKLPALVDMVIVLRGTGHCCPRHGWSPTPGGTCPSSA